MRNNLEKKWVSLIDSNRYRRFAKGRVFSRILKSDTYQNLNTFRRYLITSYKARQSQEQFSDIASFCFFIGQTKSGSSMLGGLLDAHPNIIISDEVDVLKYVSKGFNRQQIFQLLLHTSKREMMKGRVTARRLEPYSFHVPDQWQGKFSKLLVIGDSTAGKSTQKLAQDPELIKDLTVVMEGISVKVVQVIRNPFDPISIMMIRGKRSFENALQHYFEDCDTLTRIRKELGPETLYSMRYEDFVISPESQLKDLCSFLGVEPTSDYLKSCAGIMSKTPDRSRHLVDWEPSWIEQVNTLINRYDFLAGYQYSE